MQEDVIEAAETAQRVAPTTAPAPNIEVVVVIFQVKFFSCCSPSVVFFRQFRCNISRFIAGGSCGYAAWTRSCDVIGGEQQRPRPAACRSVCRRRHDNQRSRCLKLRLLVETKSVGTNHRTISDQDSSQKRFGLWLICSRCKNKSFPKVCCSLRRRGADSERGRGSRRGCGAPAPGPSRVRRAERPHRAAAGGAQAPHQLHHTQVGPEH